MSELSERLVKAVDCAIADAMYREIALGEKRQTGPAATAAVLRTLLHHDEAHLGLYPMDLEVLADEIEGKYDPPKFAGLFRDDPDLSVRVKDIARGEEAP